MASKVSEIQRPNDVPEKIGKYVIINKIGKGSTGTVFLSHDPYYRRDVAIKVYNIEEDLSLIHISEPTRQYCQSRNPSSA